MAKLILKKANGLQGILFIGAHIINLEDLSFISFVASSNSNKLGAIKLSFRNGSTFSIRQPGASVLYQYFIESVEWTGLSHPINGGADASSISDSLDVSSPSNST